VTPNRNANGRFDPKRRAPVMIAVILLGLLAAVFVYRVGEQSENNRKRHEPATCILRA
jgi:hypothetical protein